MKKKFTGIAIVTIMCLIINLLTISYRNEFAYTDQHKLINREDSISYKYQFHLQPYKSSYFYFSVDSILVKLPWAENRSYKKWLLSTFVQNGDIIRKAAHADSVFIYRDGKRYHFVLEKRIWK